MTKLFEELKRRNVFRVAVAYLAAAWLIIQVADVVLDTVSSPPWVMQALLFFLAAGFPLAVIFSWAFEITPEGLKLEHEVDHDKSITQKTGRKLDFAIIAVLAAAVLLLLVDKLFVPDPGVVMEKSVAVLPFETFSNGVDDEYFSDGLTEEILNSLAQIPELLVTARTSAFHFKGQNIPVPEIAEALGVAYIVEGSVRRAGDQIRVTAQLIRGHDAFHIWSRNFDRPAADTLTVQTDIAEQIAETLDIVLDEEQVENMKRVGLHSPEAFIAWQKGRELYDAAHGHPDMLERLAEANAYFEEVISLAPEFAQAYVQHSDHAAHVLAFSGVGVEFTDDELANARAIIQSDFDNAIRHAPDEITQRNIMLDSAILMGEWRGIDKLFVEIADDPVCNIAVWANSLMVPFGYAEQYLRTQQKYLECDPMNYAGWMGASQALKSMDAVDAAIEIGRAGLEKSPHPLIIADLLASYIVRGEFEQARNVNLRHTQSDRRQFRGEFLIASAMGDPDVVARTHEEFLAVRSPTDVSLVANAAIRGDRDLANRLAAEYDAREYGYLVLMQAPLYCECGAPWDIEYTPNFLRLLEDAGLEWPPSKNIDWPLKDW